MHTITRPHPRMRFSVSRISRDLRSLDRLDQLLDYIPHPDFEVAEKAAEILAPMPRAEEYEEKRRAARVPHDVPAELAASYAVKTRQESEGIRGLSPRFFEDAFSLAYTRATRCIDLEVITDAIEQTFAHQSISFL